MGSLFDLKVAPVLHLLLCWTQKMKNGLGGEKRPLPFTSGHGVESSTLKNKSSGPGPL